ncbi:MAG: hypothetical protein FJ137_19950 [Deltaproteobacteria bacterium]|nr:hypothetical protein [Deltaproteobacteria bacterium]
MAGLVRFSETMRGFVDDARVDEPHERHAARGRRRPGHELIFMLTVVTEDVDALIADPRHRSPVFGCVLAPVLSPRPLRVEQGSLDLFADVGAPADPAGPGRILHMRYVLPLVDDHDGCRFLLRGIKEVVRRRPWPTTPVDTTTLFVDVWRAEEPGRPLLRGVLVEGLVGVVAQALSFRGDRHGLWRYLTSYVRAVWRVASGPQRAPLRPSWQRLARFSEQPHSER